MEPRLWELMANEPRLCKHLHLPLQSGCDKILQAMHRPYDTARFTQLLQQIRAQVPDVANTTDIIVGFPGEPEEDVSTTLAFAEKCGFANPGYYTRVFKRIREITPMGYRKKCREHKQL